MTSFFHTYDLRGKYPDEIGLEEAEKVGKAYGTFIDADEVLVGRDGRKHGEDVTDAFIDGILSTGTDVAYAGVVPSPVVYFGQVENDFESSAVVTASHNPPEYTGFKFCKQDALAMSREGGMEDIQRIYERGKFETGEGENSVIDLEEAYIEAVSEEVGLDGELSVAVNFGNGATCGIGPRILQAIGCEVKGVNQEMDGEFPSHLPDPTNEEAKQTLRENMEDEDLGIIFDGDGDRVGFMLPGYGEIAMDEILAVFSEKSLQRRKGRVVHDLRASKLVPEIIEESGGEADVTRVGHTFFSVEIHEDPDVVFAGELSGHFYFPVYGFPWDDGLFAAALMCRIVSESDLRKRLEDYPDYPVSPELRIDCPEHAKEKVVKDMKEEYSDHDLSTLDGVKIQFERGWVLVRPSSTEEKMSVRCEADTEEDVDRILGEVEEKVRDSIDRNS